MQRIRSKTQEFNRRLHPYCKERQSAMQDFKLEKLITNTDCKIFGNSDRAKEILSNLNGIDKFTSPNYTSEQAISCQNYLMFTLCITNALRASNLINLSIADLQNAVHDKEYDAMVISSTKYKTSMLYGKKSIVCSEMIFSHLNKFAVHFRPKIARTNDADLQLSERYLFLSSKGGEKMSHSCISNGITHLFHSVPALKKRKK